MDPFNIGAVAENQNPSPQPQQSTPSPEPTPPNTPRPVGSISFDGSAEPAQPQAQSAAQAEPSCSGALQTPTPKKSTPWKKIALIVVAILFISGSVAAGMYGLNTYQKYGRALSTLSLLPENPNLVIIATIDAKAPQYVQLEQHLQKFPGYALFKRKLEEKENAQSIAQLEQKRLEKYGVDFEKELKPALGSVGYIVINDLSPWGSKLQSSALAYLEKTPQEPKPLALNTQDLPGAKILGEETEKDDSLPRVEFIAAIEVTDLTKAQEILKKIKEKKEYPITEKKEYGYVYFETHGAKTDSEATYEKVFAAVLGKNFIVTSSEDEMRAAIQRAYQQETLQSLTNKQTRASLDDNADFAKVQKSLDDTSADTLASAFIKVNFEKFFGQKNDCTGSSCERITDYIRYPDDIIVGLKAQANTDGVRFRAITNKQNLTGVKNIAFPTPERLPEAANGLWNDVLIEYANPAEYYNNFKKNNLTEKGLQKLDEALADANKELGINVEEDIINQMVGNASFTLFTKKVTEPQGAFIVQIKDKDRMLQTIEKITERYKETYRASITEMLSMMNKYGTSPEYAKYKEKLTKKLAAIDQAKITTTPAGTDTIYSFKIPETFVSFDYTIHENELILGSHYAVVTALLEKNPEKTLANNTLFKETLAYAPKEGFAQSFIVTQGIVNTVTYLMQKLIGELTTSFSSDENASATQAIQELDNPWYAYLAVLRTIKSIQGSSTVNEPFTESTAFFNIKELPAEEKARAEKFFEDMAEKEKAREAAKTNATALN